MGYDLCGPKGRYFRWTDSAWPEVLQIALWHGWHPTGTGAAPGYTAAEWKRVTDRSYFGNDRQRVYVRDARNLADALDRVVKAIKAGALPKDLARKIGKWYRTQEGLEALRSFAKFCRQGTFRIY